MAALQFRLITTGARIALCAASIAAAGASVGAAAQGPNLETYPRRYFDPYNQHTARDMIDRLPGFTFDAREDSRCFGGRDFIGRRTIFDPDRAGIITGFEASDRKRGMVVTLTIEGQG